MPFLSPPSARLAVYKYAKQKAFTYLYSGLQFSLLKGALCLLFFPSGHGNWWKSEFFGETLRAGKFLSGKCFGASTHGILTHSRFRYGWPSLRFEVIAAQKSAGLRKIRGVRNQRHPANFRPRGLQLVEPGVTISESMFYRGQTSRTKIGGVSLIRTTVIVRGPTPPWHFLNSLDIRIHQYLEKNWANRDWAIVFLAIFGDFWGWEPRLYSENKDFQNLSVLDDFYALHHFDRVAKTCQPCQPVGAIFSGRC